MDVVVVDCVDRHLLISRLAAFLEPSRGRDELRDKSNQRCQGLMALLRLLPNDTSSESELEEPLTVSDSFRP